MWDQVDAAGLVVRKFPDVPPAYEAIGGRERAGQGKKLVASYATKSGSALLPAQVPRP